MPRPMCFLVLSFAVLVLMPGATPASAEPITLRVAPYQAEALTKAIADNAEPSAQWIAAGESLDRYVRAACGARRQQDEAYWALLKDANPDVDVTGKLSKGRTIQFPACANWSEGTFPVRVRTNLQDVALNTIGLSDPGVIFQIKKFNALSRKFNPDETKIPFDQVVLVPAISYPVSLDTKGSAEDFAHAVFAAIKPDQNSYPTFKEDSVCIDAPLDPVVLLCKKTTDRDGLGGEHCLPGLFRRAFVERNPAC